MAFRMTEACIGCTVCAKRCSETAIHGARDALHVIDGRLCVDCGACGMICPSEAITDGAGNLVRRRKPKDIPVARADIDLCSGCGLCEDMCPFHSIEVVRREDAFESFGVASVNARRCVACKLWVSKGIKESIVMGERT